MQSADYITCDEPIKKACHQKINRILFTYQMARLNLYI